MAKRKSRSIVFPELLENAIIDEQGRMGLDTFTATVHALCRQALDRNDMATQVNYDSMKIGIMNMRITQLLAAHTIQNKSVDINMKEISAYADAVLRDKAYFER
jgi:hypothetical protein